MFVVPNRAATDAVEIVSMYLVCACLCNRQLNLVKFIRVHNTNSGHSDSLYFLYFFCIIRMILEMFIFGKFFSSIYFSLFLRSQCSNFSYDNALHQISRICDKFVYEISYPTKMIWWIYLNIFNVCTLITCNGNFFFKYSIVQRKAKQSNATTIEKKSMQNSQTPKFRWIYSNATCWCFW